MAKAKKKPEFRKALAEARVMVLRGVSPAKEPPTLAELLRRNLRPVLTARVDFADLFAGHWFYFVCPADVPITPYGRAACLLALRVFLAEIQPPT